MYEKKVLSLNLEDERDIMSVEQFTLVVYTCAY